MLAGCLAIVIIAAVYQYQSLCDKKGDRQLNIAFALSSTNGRAAAARRAS